VCSRLYNAKRIDVPAMHWIEQFRHQRQPLPLAFEMMPQNVLRHVMLIAIAVSVSAIQQSAAKKKQSIASGL
jgi:hypothetical protein